MVLGFPFHDVSGFAHCFCDLKAHALIRGDCPYIFPEHIEHQGRGLLLTMPDHVCTDSLSPIFRQYEQAVQFAVTQTEKSCQRSVIQDPPEMGQLRLQILFHPADHPVVVYDSGVLVCINQVLKNIGRICLL